MDHQIRGSLSRQGVFFSAVSKGRQNEEILAFRTDIASKAKAACWTYDKRRYTERDTVEKTLTYAGTDSAALTLPVDQDFDTSAVHSQV